VRDDNLPYLSLEAIAEINYRRRLCSIEMARVLLVPNEEVLSQCWSESSVMIAGREMEANLDLLWRRPSPLIARPCLMKEIGAYTTCK
jgi:hypothetical protein